MQRLGKRTQPYFELFAYSELASNYLSPHCCFVPDSALLEVPRSFLREVDVLHWPRLRQARHQARVSNTSPEASQELRGERVSRTGRRGHNVETLSRIGPSQTCQYRDDLESP